MRPRPPTGCAGPWHSPPPPRQFNPVPRGGPGAARPFGGCVLRGPRCERRDRDLLRPTYERTVNSLKRAERDAFFRNEGLFGGCSTFMESNSGYPKKYAMNGPMVAKTMALSTNLLYYRGYVIAARLARLLGEDPKRWGAGPPR